MDGMPPPPLPNAGNPFAAPPMIPTGKFTSVSVKFKSVGIILYPSNNKLQIK